MLFAPLLIWWNKRATDPQADLGEAFRGWFKPGWPTTYILPTGPPWFIWMLWCFNVAYVVLAMLLPPLHSTVSKLCRRRRSSSDSSQQSLPRVQSQLYYFSRKQWMKWGFIVIMVLFSLQYADPNAGHVCVWRPAGDLHRIRAVRILHA